MRPEDKNAEKSDGGLEMNTVGSSKVTDMERALFKINLKIAAIRIKRFPLEVIGEVLFYAFNQCAEKSFNTKKRWLKRILAKTTLVTYPAITWILKINIDFLEKHKALCKFRKELMLSQKQ